MGWLGGFGVGSGMVLRLGSYKVGWLGSYKVLRCDGWAVIRWDGLAVIRCMYNYGIIIPLANFLIEKFKGLEVEAYHPTPPPRGSTICLSYITYNLNISLPYTITSSYPSFLTIPTHSLNLQSTHNINKILRIIMLSHTHTFNMNQIALWG